MDGRGGLIGRDDGYWLDLRVGVQSRESYVGVIAE